MDLKLKDKTAFISGSTAGIGFAIAERLAREGAHVVINGRTQRRVAFAIQQLHKNVPHARKIEGIAADLGHKKGCATLVRHLREVDILVNNLGIFEPKRFLEIPDQDWLNIFEVNVMSGVRLSRAYLPGMKKRNWGRIVFISSESGVQIPAEMVHYGMTKTAQIAVARGIAEDCAGTGVTVNSVLAGPTASEGVKDFVAELARQQDLTPAQFEQEFFKTTRPTSLVKRFLKPDEIGAVVAFVCSPEASAITGAALRAEGGVVKAAI
jgi:NAD(P)-dependent dehydrogenase (short-subunit alcohol dehydrogenase family)